MANLTQLRILENLNGFLLIDKPVGINFATVVKTVKRKFNLVSVGHGGSLDAMASGLLILLLNDANKFTANVMGADRVHSGIMRLGMKTNTHDIHGEKIFEGKCADSLPQQGKFDAVLPDFRGDIFQTESRWCTIRKDASPAYEIADTGEHKPFLTHVYRLLIERGESPDWNFEVKGSKNLIVRTLVNDFGDALGCGAALAALRRTAIGKFLVDDAIPFDRILETEMKDFPDLILPLSKALS